MTYTLPLVRDARRCVAPDGRPGVWQRGKQPSIAAMQEAIHIAHGRQMDGLDWPQTTALWRGLQQAGWRIESEWETE